MSLDVLNKTKKVDKMFDFAEEKSKSVFDQRKIFENNVNSCQQWFSEVEVIMSADVRLSNLNVIEDQLQKVRIHLKQLIDNGIINYLFV